MDIKKSIAGMAGAVFLASASHAPAEETTRARTDKFVAADKSVTTVLSFPQVIKFGEIDSHYPEFQKAIDDANNNLPLVNANGGALIEGRDGMTLGFLGTIGMEMEMALKATETLNPQLVEDWRNGKNVPPHNKAPNTGDPAVDAFLRGETTVHIGPLSSSPNSAISDNYAYKGEKVEPAKQGWVLKARFESADVRLKVGDEHVIVGVTDDTVISGLKISVQPISDLVTNPHDPSKPYDDGQAALDTYRAYQETLRQQIAKTPQPSGM